MKYKANNIIFEKDVKETQLKEHKYFNNKYRAYFKIIEFYGKPYFQKLSRIKEKFNKFINSKKKYKWVFIVGCYNSGTSLLLTILQHHPKLSTLPHLGEGQWLTDHLVCPSSIGIPRLWAEKEELFRFGQNEKKDVAKKVKKDWLKLVLDPFADFIIEKTNANAARMLWLQENFPNSYFIHVIRNGYAVSLGIEKKTKNKINDNSNLLQKAAHQWERSAEIVLEDAKGINNFLEISYEELTELPDKTINKICKFLQIQYIDESILNNTFKIHEFNDKINNKNSERLKNMSEKQERIIYMQARKMLEHYNYSNNK